MSVEAGRADRSARWMQLDLMVLLVLTLAALASVLLSASGILRLPLVSALVLFLPGYALMSALIVGSSLSVLERVMIAIIASVSLTIVVGLVMALAGIPIERMAWAYALAGVSLVGIGAAWIRRLRNGVAGPRPSMAKGQWRQTALVVIAVLIVANVVAASRIVADDQFGSPPAQLWLIEGTDPLTADLGFRADANGGDYRVVVTAGGQVIHEYDVTVDPSGTWDMNIAFTPDQRAQQVVAQLFIGDSQTDERSVDLQPLPASNAP